MGSIYFEVSKRSFIYVLVIVAFSFFVSCKKDDAVNTGSVKGEAKIKVINASQGSSAIDLYLDDTKINTSALAYGEGSEYIKIASGEKIAKVNQGLGILESSAGFNFVPTFSYTAFFVEDKLGKGNVITFEDNLGAVEADKSRVRFINLSPNFTNTLNVNLPGGELLVSALPFKEASSYFLVHSGVSVGVSVVGSATLKIADGNEFEGGKNYTVWISGTSNATLTIHKITYN